MVPPTHTVYEELDHLTTAPESDSILEEPHRELRDEDAYDAQILAGLVTF